MNTRRRRDRPSVPKPEWFEATRYSTAARNLDESGWLHQISARLAVRACWKLRELPFDDEYSWGGTGTRLWAAIRKHGVLPVPQSSDIAQLDPYRNCSSPDYSAIRTLLTCEVYDALEQLCSNGVVWDRTEDGTPFIVEGSLDDVYDDEDGEDAIALKSLSHCLYDVFPGDYLSTTYIGVDLNVSDKELTQSFDGWLKEARGKMGYEKQQNAILGARRFANWSRFRVLGYLDLDFWADTQDITYQQKDIADLLFPDNSRMDAETVRNTVIKNVDLLELHYRTLRAFVENNFATNAK
jgi:hypothetical protein